MTSGTKGYLAQKMQDEMHRKMRTDTRSWNEMRSILLDRYTNNNRGECLKTIGAMFYRSCDDE